MLYPAENAKQPEAEVEAAISMGEVTTATDTQLPAEGAAENDSPRESGVLVGPRYGLQEPTPGIVRGAKAQIQPGLLPPADGAVTSGEDRMLLDGEFERLRNAAGIPDVTQESRSESTHNTYDEHVMEWDPMDIGGGFSSPRTPTARLWPTSDDSAGAMDGTGQSADRIPANRRRGPPVLIPNSPLVPLLVLSTATWGPVTTCLAAVASKPPWKWCITNPSTAMRRCMSG